MIFPLVIQGAGVAGKITNLIGASGAAANVVKGGKAAMNGGAAAVALGNQAMNIGSGVSTGTTAMNVGHAAMHVQCSTRRDKNFHILTFCEFSQACNELCTHKTYHHDPQPLPVNLITIT